MNEARKRRPRRIAGLTVLGVCGAVAGVLAYWAVMQHSDVLYLFAGGTWQAWSVSCVGGLGVLGMCAGRMCGILRSTSDRKLQRSVAHVQATLFRRT